MATPPRRSPPRADLIVEVQDRIMELLQEHAGGPQQLRPDEGLLAVELTFLTLFDNAMENAPPDLRPLEVDRHMKSIVRLSTRIAAWPARPLDSKDRH
jgi:hypothetical protein